MEKKLKNKSSNFKLTISGFTLIELLAVIIILAVIALIATPLVLDVVEDAREKSRVESVNGLIEATKLYINESMLNEELVLDGNLYQIIKGRVSGSTPEDGEIYIDNNKQIGIAVQYDNYCYVKPYTEEKVSKLLGDCKLAQITDLSCYQYGEVLTSYNVNQPNCVKYFSAMFSADSGVDVPGFCAGTATLQGFTLDTVISVGLVPTQDLIVNKVIENLIYDKKCKSCLESYSPVLSYEIDTLKCVSTLGPLFIQQGISSTDVDTLCGGGTINMNGQVLSFKDFFVGEGDVSQLESMGVIKNVTHDTSQIHIINYNCYVGNTMGAPEISDIVLPSTTVSIASSAFENKSITSVDFSQAKKLETIGARAFNNNNLSELTLKDLPELTSIGGSAFSGNDLSNLNIENLPKLTELNGSDFDKITNLVIKNMDSLDSIINFGTKLTETLTLSGLPKLSEIGNSTFRDNHFSELMLSDLPELTIIGYGAFSNCGINSLNLSNLPKLETIDEWAFSTNQLTSLTLSELPNLSKIGRYAFYGNNISNSLDLRSLSSLTTIEENAFVGNNISSLNLSGLTKLETIKDGAFEGNGITSLDLSGLTNLTEIANEAFFKNKITKLNLSGLIKLETIGKSAFSQNDIGGTLDLSDLTGLITIGQDAFSGNELDSLELRDLPNLTTIGEDAFISNNIVTLNLNSLTNLTTIGYGAFMQNEIVSLDLTNLPNLTTIDEFAFYRNLLTTLDLSDLPRLTTINGNSFGSNSIEEIKLPKGVTTIGTNAFSSSNGSSGKTMTLPDGTVKHVTYYDNPNLTKIVNPTGREFDWYNIVAGSNNGTPFETGTINIISKNIIVTGE